MSASTSLPLPGAVPLGAVPFDPVWLFGLAGAGAAACLFLYVRRTRQLRRSESQYREVVDHATSGIYEMSPDGAFIAANPALACMFGYEAADDMPRLSSEKTNDHFVAPKREDLVALLRTSDRVERFESEIRRADGTSAWIEETAQAVRGPQGELQRVRGFVTDVTERKKLAAELAASEQRYRRLFDHLPIGLVEYDYGDIETWFAELRASGVVDLAEWLRVHPEALRSASSRVRIVSANPETLRLIGLRSLEEGVANLERIYTADACEARRRTFAALWEGKTESDGEFTVQTLGGHLLRVAYRWRVPVIDGRRCLERTQLVLVDVTQMKSAEQAMAAERERLSVTLRAMPEAVLTVDQAGVIQYMNDAAVELTGWTEASALGRTLREVCVIGSDTPEQTVAGVAAALASGRPVDFPPYTIVRSREGVARSVEGRCVPVHDATPRVTGAVLVLREVTQRSRLEADLLRASKMESIGVLAGGIAHDFNNLLSIVMGNISLALLDERAREAASNWLREAERATMRAKDLTQQLLTFAKGGEPVRSVVALGEVVREAADFALHGSSAQCEFEIASDLWPADADKGQIAQVVQNLMINAIQAMPGGGGIRLSLANEALPDGKVATLPAGNYVCLEIADSGRGIAPEHLPRIFEPFFTTKEFGTGLGLATVYSIIQKHRGYVTVESQVGRGSTFRFWLPAARPAPSATAATARPFEHIEGSVLFMDDEEPIRMMTQALLERLGLRVTVTAEGAEAVREYASARAAGRPYDVVIFDLTVPGGMGGAAAMREILKINPAAKGIVSSGYSSDPVMANYRAHGFRGSMPKPYRIAEFARLIREVIEN